MLKKAACILLIFTFAFALALPIFAEEAVEQYGRVFSKNNHGTKKIALTFDDGPHPVYTEKILKILDKYGIKATFFVIGQNIEYFPQTFKKTVEMGHEIGNHTYTHTSEKLDITGLCNELKHCEALVESIAGKRTVLFRPPRGEYDKEMQKAVFEKGYSMITWSIDTEDWRHTPSGEIVKNIVKNVKGGDIILMHDYISGKNTTCDAIEAVIPKLMALGYEFVTVSELMRE